MSGNTRLIRYHGEDRVDPNTEGNCIDVLCDKGHLSALSPENEPNNGTVAVRESLWSEAGRVNQLQWVSERWGGNGRRRS